MTNCGNTGTDPRGTPTSRTSDELKDVQDKVRETVALMAKAMRHAEDREYNLNHDCLGTYAMLEKRFWDLRAKEYALKHGITGKGVNI